MHRKRFLLFLFIQSVEKIIVGEKTWSVAAEEHTLPPHHQWQPFVTDQLPRTLRPVPDATKPSSVFQNVFLLETVRIVEDAQNNQLSDGVGIEVFQGDGGAGQLGEAVAGGAEVGS